MIKAVPIKDTKIRKICKQDSFSLRKKGVIINTNIPFRFLRTKNVDRGTSFIAV